jgi:hypothetical protein
MGGNMIGDMDEYLIHQTEKPISQVASQHPEWQDRFYFSIHDRDGEFAAITGLGAFPNRNMIQAYMFAVHRGRHYAYLNVRPLDNDRHVMRAGTLSYEVVASRESWRLGVADEANGLRGDLVFNARCPLYAFTPVQWSRGDKVVVRQMHYTQAGRYEGQFSIGGETYTDLIGIRDRSWGIRAMADVPIWIWIAAQFPDFCISAWHWETSEGEPIHSEGAVTYESGEVRPIRAIEHDLAIEPGAKHPTRAVYRLSTEKETLTLSAEEISTIYIGPLGQSWDESDPEALKRAGEASFGFDQYTRFTLDGRSGIGIVEYMMTGGSKRYGVPPTRIG